MGYDVTVLAQESPLEIDAAFIDNRLRANPEVRRSLAEVNLLSALALFKTFAGDRRHVMDWLADGELNLDRNLRLEYLAGQAHNTWEDSIIYNGMTRHLTYPEGLFGVNPAAETFAPGFEISTAPLTELKSAPILPPFSVALALPLPLLFLELLGTFSYADRTAQKPLARIIQCAVERRRFSVGAKPTRQLSLQPVAIGAAVEVTKPLKPSV